jgi:UDP-N-acetylglucosamine:LPS N-acetylglucosamine transferase
MRAWYRRSSRADRACSWLVRGNHRAAGQADPYNPVVRVQIVSSKVGGGHQSVAQALRESFDAIPGLDVTVWVDDLYMKHTRFPGSRFPWIYATMTRRFPRLWRLFYDVTNRPPSGPRYNWIGDVIGGPSLSQLIAERRPDSVITVLPGTTGFVARSVLRSKVAAKVEVVVTDWADVHLGWTSTFPAQYTVPTENAVTTLTSVGIPASCVDRPGFLVRKQFSGLELGPAAKCRVRERLGLPRDRFLILAMVGAEGSPAALAHLRALARTPLDCDILVVCGRNRRLFRMVERFESVNRIVPLGFVENVAELMVASDALLTKTGGVTLAEAFVCRLPVLAFDPLPGQEEGNARYVVSRGAAELATSPSQLASLVAEIRWSPQRRSALVEAGADLASPGAATITAQAIVNRIRLRHEVGGGLGC